MNVNLTTLELQAIRCALLATLESVDDDELLAYFGDRKGIAAAERARKKINRGCSGIRTYIR